MGGDHHWPLGAEALARIRRCPWRFAHSRACDDPRFVAEDAKEGLAMIELAATDID
ncbi:MAG: hypothetical protein ACRDU5_08485 [Mycobacterium sp.]